MSSFAEAWAARDVVAPRPDAPGLFLALAPMDGVTDHVFRDLMTAQFDGQSGISLCVSEFVRVTNQAVPAHVFMRHCPELAHGGSTPAGVPVFVQLLGGNAGPMAEAAVVATGLGAPGIDLNFGCPAKRVNGHDGGAALLRAPERVERVTRAVRAAVDPAIPVTVKIRVGWDSAMPVAELAAAADAGGAAWLTIHARTRAQLYKPPVDWPALGRAREACSMPVVANGDLFSVRDLHACAEQSGCASFMIGRGAMGRPDLFAAARRAPTTLADEPPALSRAQMVQRLLDYVARLQRAGASDHATLGRSKQWLRLGAPLREDLRGWFDTLKRCQTLDAFVAPLESVLADREHAA